MAVTRGEGAEPVGEFTIPVSVNFARTLEAAKLVYGSDIEVILRDMAEKVLILGLGEMVTFPTFSGEFADKSREYDELREAAQPGSVGEESTHGRLAPYVMDFRSQVRPMLQR